MRDREDPGFSDGKGEYDCISWGGRLIDTSTGGCITGKKKCSVKENPYFQILNTATNGSEKHPFANQVNGTAINGEAN